MRKTLVLVAAMFAVLWAIAGTLLGPGLAGEFSNGAIIKGVVLASTNATQTASVKAVYEWPVFGEVEEETVFPVTVRTRTTRIDTLTNWCDYATASAVTNISGSVTNVVYYDGITVATNAVISSVQVMKTNTAWRTAVVGKVAITNTLYSLTASGGVATNGETRLIGAGARLLIESAPVTIIWE